MAIQTTAITANSNHAAVTRFRGFSLEGSAAAVVKFRLASVSGTIVWRGNPASSETVSIMFPEAIPSPDGIYVELVSGTLGDSVLFSD